MCEDGPTVTGDWFTTRPLGGYRHECPVARLFQQMSHILLPPWPTEDDDLPATATDPQR